MTAVEVAFRYANTPGPSDMRALDSVRDVYGVRRIVLNEKERAIRVEYDASRLNDSVIAALLRRAGIDVCERLALA